MSSKLYIDFTLDSGKTHTVGIDDPKEDITKTEVQTWANNVINKKIIEVNGSYTTGIKTMYIRTVTDNELE